MNWLGGCKDWVDLLWIIRNSWEGRSNGLRISMRLIIQESTRLYIRWSRSFMTVRCRRSSCMISMMSWYRLPKTYGRIKQRASWPVSPPKTATWLTRTRSNNTPNNHNPNKLPTIIWALPCSTTRKPRIRCRVNPTRFSRVRATGGRGVPGPGTSSDRAPVSTMTLSCL